MPFRLALRAAHQPMPSRRTRVHAVETQRRVETAFSSRSADTIYA